MTNKGVSYVGIYEVPDGVSPELRAGLVRYADLIASVGGYGATVCAVTLGHEAQEVTGVLSEAGFGGWQPCVTTSEGRRYRVDGDTLRAAPRASNNGE